MAKNLIKSIKVENFRSFHKLNLENFSRINVFIGKNNLGKSSLLEAVYLGINGVDVIHLSPIWHIIKRRGVVQRVLNVPDNAFVDYFKKHFFHKSHLNSYIKVKMGSKDYCQRFEFEEQPEFYSLEDFIGSRQLDLDAREKWLLKKTVWTERQRRFYLVIGILYHNKRPSILLLSDKNTVGYHRFIYLKGDIPSNSHFKFFLDTCMLCGSSQRMSDLMKKLEPEMAEGIYLQLKSLLSSYFDEKVKSIEPSFSDFYVNMETGRIPFSMLGDGIRYFTIHFLVLNVEKPSFVFLEEPENYMHPKMLDSLVQAIMDSKHQIFIVTHSLEFLKKLLWKAKINEQDLKVFGFYGLTGGMAEIETYNLEQAYTVLNKLEIDLR